MTTPEGLPYQSTQQEEIDSGHLKTLSIFWYIIAALQALGGCGVLAYVVLVVMMGMGMASSGRSDDAAAGTVFGGFFGCIGLFALAIWWGMAFLNFVVARSLPNRRRRVLCFIMGVWVCFFIPLGTVLGVMTLMVLSRPSVKATSV